MEKVFIVKRNIPDNSKFICDNAKFIGITEMSVHVHLPDCGKAVGIRQLDKEHRNHQK